MAQDKPEQSEAPEEPSPADVRPRFPIVGVGASAGGLDALRDLLRGIPPASGLTLVVIQHLDPTHESQMASLLAGYTRLRVLPAEDGMAVEPGAIYTIPAGQYLSLKQGRLHLEPPAAERRVRMPVDFFFRSLAEERQEQAICVVLSGSGTDGALGVRAVRGVGGLAIAQDPETAEYDSMPRSAIATGLVDLVLEPQAVAGAILQYARRSSVAVISPAQPDSDVLEGILNLLLQAGGGDFRGYKRGTILRRIERRMGLVQVTSLAAYLQVLRDKPDEAAALAKDILIGVTGFFRDAEAYEELRRVAVRPLVQASVPDRPLRVWVAGCSTGEEAYSIAILIAEELQAAHKDVPVQIFASDLDDSALEIGRAGVYPESIAADVSADRLARFFVSADHSYQIIKEIRDSVVFTSHNIVADPPFSRIDLVSCRNVLIYLGTELQRRVVSFLGFAATRGGYLFLGRSDNLPSETDTFTPVSAHWRIYQRTAESRHEMVDFPALAPRAALALPAPRAVPRPPPQLMAAAQRLLLEHYAAGLVLIDAHGEIGYFYGDVDRYLRRPTGPPDLNLFTTARENLPRRLRAAVRQALERGEPVRFEQVPVEGSDGTSFVNVTVRPSADAASSQQPAPGGSPGGLVAVIFEAVPAPAEPLPEAAAGTEAGADASLVSQLESDLASTREELRVTVAEHAVATEELRAAHEEAVSMNEELRSTNEELEAHKEELQSINEELNTLNAELRERIDELNETNSDLTNLFSATEIATVFLDRELRIRRFTPTATALLNLLSIDVGRPVSHISQRFEGNELASMAEHVLRDLSPVEKEVRTAEGRWYLMRLLAYRSIQNRIEGVVVTFTDVTGLKQAEEASERARKASEEARIYAEGIVATVREPLLVLDADLRVLSTNPGFYRTFGTIPGETIGRPLTELGNRQWDIPALTDVLVQVIPEQTELRDFEVEHTFPGLGRRTMLLNARRVDQEGERPFLILLAIEDITERRRAQLAEAMIAEIGHRTKNNLAIVAGLLQAQADRQAAEGVNTTLIRDAVTRIRTFAALHEQIRAEQSEEIELLEAVKRIAEITRSTLAVDAVRIEVTGDPVCYPFQDGTNVAVIANELITNALKYGAADSSGELRVTVILRAEEGRLTLSVWNSGHPIAEGFTPTEATATGLFLVRSIVVDHYRGEFRIGPHQGGTLAQVVIPGLGGRAPERDRT